jgi:hypothetical protein
MPLFGPSKKQLEDTRYHLQIGLMATIQDQVESELIASGSSAIQSDGPVRTRLMRAVVVEVTRFMETLPPEALRYKGWEQRVEAAVPNMVMASKRRFEADIAQHPPIPATSTREARYGPNWQALEAYLANLAAMRPDQWIELAQTAVTYLSDTSGRRDRMEQLVGSAVFRHGEAVRAHDLADQNAWANVDISELAAPRAAAAARAIGNRGGGRIQSQMTLWANNAGGALIAQNHLSAEDYSLLCTFFVRQVMGDERYRQVSEEFKRIR